MSTNKTKYAKKMEQWKNGTYNGKSPFNTNIPEFQHLRPLTSYPHLKGMRTEERNDPYTHTLQQTA